MLEPLTNSILYLTLLEHLTLGTSEIEQEVMMPGTKSDNLHVILSTFLAGFYKFFFDLLTCTTADTCLDIHPNEHLHTINQSVLCTFLVNKNPTMF